ncbi:hypothetical protein CRG98_036254 [Punica granatum]|uniref:Nuclear transcription factor Y subunit C-1-like n=1 Tax=Punica granatum TaxID=22663 RepID=A0A2I0IH93_PUNGR|nr:hypothetical protein CRG98_036254 [Punica granatum]
MENNPQQPQSSSSAAAAPSSYPGGGAPFHHLLQQQQQHQLQMFWSYQHQEIEQVNDFKNHQLPLARIKKIMKADEDIKDESAVGMVGPPTATGVPYHYPPIGQPAPGLGGMMIGRPAMDPAAGVYMQPPSQAWQSVWQNAAAGEDGYAAGPGGGSNQTNLDGQS